MKLRHSDAKVQLDIDVSDEGLTIPREGWPEMIASKVHLIYRSECGKAWSCFWQLQGHSAVTGNVVLDLVSQRVPRRIWPTWLVRLIEERRPVTGDGSLPTP